LKGEQEKLKEERLSRKEQKKQESVGQEELQLEEELSSRLETFDIEKSRKN
jgi:hypothetical protein